MKFKKIFKPSILHRWHRSIGIISACFVIVLSVTGLLLQHSDEFRFPQKFLSSQLLLSWYGIKPNSVISYKVETQDKTYWVSHAGESIYLNEHTITGQYQGISGVAQHPLGLVVVSSKKLLLLDKTGQLIEQLSIGNGLPESVLGITNDQNNNIILRGTNNNWLLNSQLLQWDTFKYPQTTWSMPDEPPIALLKTIQANDISHQISWERFLLDLHSGRLFGQYGHYVMDFAAITMLILAVTGCIMWLKRR